MNFNVCSFNLRGLNSDIRKDQLAQDLVNYKIDVLCLQETKISNGVDQNIRGNRLLCFPTKSRYYGCGFLIQSKWIDKVFRTWKVSDRICVLQVKIDVNLKKQQKQSLITIVNVYGPTLERAEKHPDMISHRK